MLHFMSEVLGREQEKQEHPLAAGRASHQDPVLKSEGHRGLLLGVTWMSHIQPPHPLLGSVLFLRISSSQECPLPRNVLFPGKSSSLCDPSTGNPKAPPSPAWMDPSGMMAANLCQGSSVPLDASLAHREGLWSHSIAPGSHSAFPGRADPSRLLSIPGSATAASPKPSTSCWVGQKWIHVLNPCSSSWQW